jgi:hypothetical protein
MRWFIYNPAGGYVSHELDAPVWAGPGDAWSLVISPELDAMAFTRGQMLDDPERREALERWEAGDDSAYQVADAA